MRRSHDSRLRAQSRLHTTPRRAGSTAVRVLGLLGIGWWLVGTAHAESPTVSASVYPPQTKLTYFPTWSNQQFDCNFGLFCYQGFNRPFFHFFTQDQLHRTGGWAMWGEWHGDRMGFELYSSVYSDQLAQDNITWNRLAAADEQAALLRLQRAKAARTLPSVLPDGVQGGTFAENMDRAGWHTLFLTVWWGATHEVEAVVMYPLTRKGDARRYLIQQVRAAVQISDRGT